MKVTVVAITIRCGDSYSSALALKRSSPGCYLTCRNMVLTVWSFIAPHFFPSYFSLARPFCLIYFPPVSFLSSFLIFLLSLSLSFHLPRLWISVGYRCQRCFGQRADNAIPASKTVIIGLSSCQQQEQLGNLPRLPKNERIKEYCVILTLYSGNKVG